MCGVTAVDLDLMSRAYTYQGFFLLMLEVFSDSEGMPPMKTRQVPL